MDEDVIKAMARWPDVPAAYGWLSLDARGRWRLHPAGDAAAGGPGEAIDHPGVQAFMNRNYACESRDWYVQNGPQRVYVRLDAAPYLLCRADAGPGLQTHTGLVVSRVTHWWLDEDGRLYATTDRGPAMVHDRELPLLLERLRTATGEPALQVLERGLADAWSPLPDIALDDGLPVTLARLARADVPARLSFQANPTPRDPRAGR
ncbi:MAG: DUF2946 family protein [Bordetella sp.]|uniref:DUF2946 family protein n=1 Tax=Bordetella sp. TaxID=28081 RepID=UPI003F7C04E5